MWPSAAAPQRGVFVRDQVEALRRRPGVEVEVFSFPSGPRALLRAIATIRRRTRGARTTSCTRTSASRRCRRSPPARAGRRDAARQRPLRAPLEACDARRAAVHRAARRGLARVQREPAGRGLQAARRGAAGRDRARALPPDPRAEARARLGLDPAGPYLLFPHDPARPLKRFDRAREAAGDVPLLTLGSVDPEEVPYWINAANAVLVPSQDEGFGLSVIEALACGVPAFGTPVGIHPVALHGIDGAFCEEWDAARWRAALRPVSRRPTRASTAGRRAELFSADRMAARVVEAWHEIAAQDRRPAQGPHPPGLYSAVRAHRRPRSRATMSGLLRRIKRSRTADAGDPPAEQQAAGPEGANTTAETAPAGDEAEDERASGRHRARDRGRPRPARGPRRARCRRAAAVRPPRPPAPPAALPAPRAGADAARPRRARLRGPPHRRRRLRRPLRGDRGQGRAAVGARRRERRDRAGARRPALRVGRVRARRRRDLRRLRRALRQRRPVLLALRDADRPGRARDGGAGGGAAPRAADAEGARREAAERRTAAGDGRGEAGR